MKIFIVFSVFVLLSSCSNPDLPVYSHLDSLRVIALIANLPEVNPGASVTITPYISDSTGAGRALTYSAVACLDPGIAAGLAATCTGSSSAVVLASSQPVTALLAAQSYTGSVNSLSVTVPANILNGKIAIDIYNGINFLVAYQLSASDGTTTSAFRRIKVSQGHTLNTNPGISDILLSGVLCHWHRLTSHAEHIYPSEPQYQQRIDIRHSMLYRLTGHQVHHLQK